MQSLNLKIVLGDIINPYSDTKLDYLQNGALVLKQVSDGYKVLELGQSIKMLKKYAKARYIELEDFSDYLILPSFFDAHFHWVQDDVRLMPKDSLLEWLSKYTWPYENKFKSQDYALKKAKLFSKELLSVGTLGGAVYASIHPHTVDLALKHFVGDFVAGNVLMTMESPDYLLQTPKSAVSIAERLSKKHQSQYAVTPRFAITTHPEVMQDTAASSRKNKSFIQTHLNESAGEIEFVLSLYRKIPGFENVKSYTEIYHRCKVLGPKTIMGHVIHNSDEELKLLSKTKTKIAHCPTSNAPVKDLGLGSGLFDFGRVEKYKIDWALASDIGGGPYLSMFDVMRGFVELNKKQKKSSATFTKALYRSTLAGAKILGLEKECGNLAKNKWANFIIIDRPKHQKDQDAEKVLSKIILQHKNNRANYDHLVLQTYYRGRPQL